MRLNDSFILITEPGYYKDNEFGIRLETILRVIRKSFEVCMTQCLNG